VADALRRAKIDVDHVDATGAAEHWRHDLVVFAVRGAELPDAVAAHAGAIAQRTGVLVAVREPLPDGHLPTAYVAERVSSWAIGALAGDPPLERRAAVQLAADDAAFARQVGDALAAAGLAVTRTPLADLRVGRRRFAPAGEKAKAGAGRAA
jgi:hypothetical protein